MIKKIIKLQPGDVVTIDNDRVIIEAKENTTAENSDVKCFGTSDNPMTESEWNEYRRTVKAGPRPD